MNVTAIQKRVTVPAAVLGTVGAAMAPAIALAEGETTTADMSGITTAITGTANTVATNALSMIAALLPVLAPIVAAIIIVRIGMRFINRHSS